MTFEKACELKRGDSVDYYGMICSVESVDKRCGLITIKYCGQKGFVACVWPRSCRKVRDSNA